jgi:hypothetical protein
MLHSLRRGQHRQADGGVSQAGKTQGARLPQQTDGWRSA